MGYSFRVLLITEYFIKKRNIQQMNGKVKFQGWFCFAQGEVVTAWTWTLRQAQDRRPRYAKRYKADCTPKACLPYGYTECETVQDALQNTNDVLAAIVDGFRQLKRPLPSALQPAKDNTPVFALHQRSPTGKRQTL